MTNRTKSKTCKRKKSPNSKIYLISENRLATLPTSNLKMKMKIKNSTFQEALDRLTVIKQTQQQLEQMKSENKHLREMAAQREEIEVGVV